MSEIRISALYSAIERYLVQGLMIVTIAIMARLLTPAETGLYLIVNALVLLCDGVRSFGVVPFIVQLPVVEKLYVRTAFTSTLLISVCTSVALIAFATPISHLFGQPEFGPMLRIAAIGFMVAPFSTPLVGLMQRELAFGQLAFINTVAAGVNTAVTLGLGLAGHGAASYMWGLVAAAVATAVLCFRVRPEPWVFRPTLAEFDKLARFGAVSSFVALINAASDVLPRLLLGRLLGLDAVGLYGRAITICQLPDRALVQALQPVVLPAMARHAREGGDLKDVYLRGHAMMSAFQWPALVLLAALADPVVRVLLGAQWEATAPLVRLIALATMALAPAFMTFPVLVAMGHIRDTMLASLISLPPSMAIVVGASQLGLEAVAASLLVAAPLQMAVALFFVRRAIGLSWRELVSASRASLGLAVGTATIPGLVLLLASPDGLTLGPGPTLLAAAGGAAGWLIALRYTRHPAGQELAAVWRMVTDRAARLSLVPQPGRE